MEFNATFIVAAISFIVFVFIMNAICYKPIENIVEQRKKFISDTENEAKNNLEKSDFLLKDKEEKLSETKKSTKAEIFRQTEVAKSRRNELQQAAKQASVEKVAVAHTELEKSKDDAKAELSQKVEELAGNILDKILG